MNNHSKRPKVAVVILGYNSRQYLAEFIPCIVASDYDDMEIIYVDNASVDNSAAFVKQHFPDIRIIRIKKNRGFTNGYVEALPHVDAEYYVIINSDVAVTPGWITPIIDLMDNDKSIAACQPKIRHQRRKSYFDYGGGSGGYIDKYGYPFCRGRIFDHIEEDIHQYDDVKEIFWASGACLFIRAEVYHAVGGFDNDFYAHMEEIDLCWRIKNAGYKLMVVPESIVYHVGGSVITYGSFTKIYRNYRNNLIMLLKNLPSKKMLKTILIRLLLDHVAAYKGLFSGHFTEFIAIAAAHFQFIFRITRWLKSRKVTQQLINQPNLTGIYNKSIVYEFFIQKRKKFSDLNIK